MSDTSIMYITFLFIVYLCSLVDANQFRCDYAYFSNIKGYLKYNRIPSNWQIARLRCHLEGSILASPINSGILSAMKTLMETDGGISSVFTGINAMFSSGDFFSIEGIPLYKIPHIWAKNEPDNVNDQEQYIMMLPSGELADVNGTKPLPYFCYKKTKKNLFMSNCGTTDPGYELETRTGSCYKFHSLLRTWSRAFMTCAAEGGYLAIINDETELQILKDIFAKHPPETLHHYNSDWKKFAFVGFHDWGERGEYLTTKGQTFEEAGYGTFIPGHPVYEPDRNCGGIERDAKYNNLLCTAQLAFICEKDPESLLCEG